MKGDARRGLSGDGREFGSDNEGRLDADSLAAKPVHPLSGRPMGGYAEHRIKRGCANLIVMAWFSGIREYPARRRTDAAAKRPEAEWRQQQGQEQSSDYETARPHDRELSITIGKTFSQCLLKQFSTRIVTRMQLRLLITLESVDTMGRGFDHRH